MSATTIAISLIANDMTGGAFGSVIGNAMRLTGSLGLLGRSLKKLSPAMKETGLVALGAGLAFEAFKAPVEFGVESAAQLEYRLVSLQNALQADADTAPLLTNAINDMAIRTVFSSGEASDAFTQLVEMGFNAQEVLYGFGPAADSLMDGAYHAKEALDGLGNQALDMAQAMRTDAVQGAELLGAALNTFKNDGMTAKEAADLLTGAFLNGVPSAEALQQGIAGGGAAAAAAGVPLKEYLGILDILAKSGLSASTAAASLQYYIQSLTAPIDKQKTALKDLGLMTLGGADGFKVLSSKLYDANGNFIGLAASVNLLGDALDGKTQQQKLEAIAELFNVRSGKAAKILENIENFQQEYDGIQARFAGTDVASMADKQLHTLLGAWDAFKDSFTSMMANIFLPILPIFTNFILKVNDLISVVTNLPEAMRKNIAVALLLGLAISGLTLLIAGAVFIGNILAAVLGALSIPFALVAGTIAIVIGVIAALIGYFFAVKSAIESNSTLMSAWNAVIGFLGSMLGVLRDQGMQLLNSLKLLLPVWDVLKVVLAVVGGIILGVLVVAVAIVIGVLIALVAIVRVLIEVFAAAGTFIGGVFSAIGTFVHNFVGTLQAGFSQAQSIVTTVIHAIGNLFPWLYNHNYYIKALVDTITSKMHQAQAVISSVMNTIRNVFSAAWNAIVVVVGGAISSLVGRIQGGVGQAGGAAQSIVDRVKGVIQALAGFMLQAGANAMHMLANGIANAAGAVIAKAQAIADQVKRLLGFHSPPPEGPLSDSDQYMPNMMRMYAEGIDAHMPVIGNSLDKVSGVIANRFMTPNIAASQVPVMSAQSGLVVIPITLDGKQIAQYTVNLVDKKIVQSGASRLAR